jgi:feruloyl esterase
MVGEYCKVLGSINPVDPAAPPIKFQVNLPASWNGKATMFGGGGYNGIIGTGLGNVPAGPVTSRCRWARGTQPSEATPVIRPARTPAVTAPSA